MARFCAGAAIVALAALAGAATACSRAAPAGGAQPGARMKPAAPAAKAVRWTRFVDPAEHAFSLEVPAGWQVSGGSQRMSAVEIRTGVTLRAPDGSMELFYGDNGVPIFTTPNQYLQMGGFREGSTYSPGYGQNMLVASYQRGERFAGGWGNQRIGSVCAGASLQGARPLPEATRAMDNTYARYGIQTSIHAGEARFGCTWRGRPGAGYVFAATELVQNGIQGIWSVKSLAGYAAAADRADEAANLLAHVAASFQVDPGWLARQQGLTANVSRIVADTNAAVSQSIIQAGQNRAAGMDRAMARAAQGRRGTATFDDPVEGRRELQNTAHQWRLPDGSVVGTNGSQPPVPGAQELPRVP